MPNYGGKVVGVMNTVGSGWPYSPPWSGASPISTTTETNIEAVINGYCQTSTQNGGVAGASGTDGADWGNMNWSTLTTWAVTDGLVAHMPNAAHRMLNVYSAPFWLLGTVGGAQLVPQTTAAFWASLTSYSVADAQVANFASFVLYMAKRYVGAVPSPNQAWFAAHPLTHLSLWSELQGYYDPTVVVGGYYRWDRYVTLYNAVWAALKGDPATSAIKIGGPYAVAIGTSIPTGQTPDIHGAWGAVDNRITRGLSAFAGVLPLTIGTHVVPPASGCDFMALDLGAAPAGLSTANELARFAEVIGWYKRVVCPAFSPPADIIVHEVYWAGGGSALPAVLDACFDAGASAVYLFHQALGKACLLVDGNGQPTDAHVSLSAYRWPDGSRVIT